MNPSAPTELRELLLAASNRRAALCEDPTQTAYRLFHGYGEGCPGLCVDRLGDALVVTHRPELEDRVQGSMQPLISHLSPALVVAKLPRGRSEPRVIHGEPTQELTVFDNGLKFRVEPLAPRRVDEAVRAAGPP